MQVPGSAFPKLEEGWWIRDRKVEEGGGYEIESTFFVIYWSYHIAGLEPHTSKLDGTRLDLDTCVCAGTSMFQ